MEVGEGRNGANGSVPSPVPSPFTHSPTPSPLHIPIAESPQPLRRSTIGDVNFVDDNEREISETENYLYTTHSTQDYHMNRRITCANAGDEGQPYTERQSVTNRVYFFDSPNDDGNSRPSYHFPRHIRPPQLLQPFLRPEESHISDDGGTSDIDDYTTRRGSFSPFNVRSLSSNLKLNSINFKDIDRISSIHTSPYAIPLGGALGVVPTVTHRLQLSSLMPECDVPVALARSESSADLDSGGKDEIIRDWRGRGQWHKGSESMPVHTMSSTDRVTSPSETWPKSLLTLFELSLRAVCKSATYPHEYVRLPESILTGLLAFLVCKNQEKRAIEILCLTDQLTELRLSHRSALAVEWMQGVHRHRDLTFLRLGDCHNITDDILQNALCGVEGSVDSVYSLPLLSHVILRRAYCLNGATLTLLPSSLTHLDISTATVLQDSAIVALASSHSSLLRKLFVEGAPLLSSVALKAISGFSQLQSLCLNRCVGVTDESIQWLCCVPPGENGSGDGLKRTTPISQSLTYLDISDCPLLTDAVMPALLALSSLSHLNLARSKVGIGFISEVHSLLSLSSLCVSNTAVTDKCVATLVSRRLKAQESKPILNLELSGKRITDSSLSYLLHLSSLTSLNLGRSSITDDGASRLRHLHNLRALSLRWTRVTDECMHLLFSPENNISPDKLNQTGPLDESGIPISIASSLSDESVNSETQETPILQLGDGVGGISLRPHRTVSSRLPAPRDDDAVDGRMATLGSGRQSGGIHFSLSSSDSVVVYSSASSSESSSNDVRYSKQLRSISSYVEASNDAKLVFLPKNWSYDVCLPPLPRLQYLDLSVTGVTDDGLSALRHCKELICLSLFSLAHVTDKGLLTIAEVLPSLCSLDLCGTKVTDLGISYLQPLQRLQVLKLNGNSNISIAIVPSILLLSSMETLEVRSTAFSRQLQDIAGANAMCWVTETMPGISVKLG